MPKRSKQPAARTPLRKRRTPKPLTTDQEMAVATWDELRRTPGVVSEIAKDLGIRRQAVHQWKVVPLERVVDVERITGVRRGRLRPDSPLTNEPIKHNTRSGVLSSLP
jgi:hypothetical protein